MLPPAFSASHGSHLSYIFKAITQACTDFLAENAGFDETVSAALPEPEPEYKVRTHSFACLAGSNDAADRRHVLDQRQTVS